MECLPYGGHVAPRISRDYERTIDAGIRIGHRVQVTLDSAWGLFLPLAYKCGTSFFSSEESRSQSIFVG